jgi:hypothetical protein
MRVQLYNVPDKHLYDPLPLRAIHALRVASWQRRAALISAGTALGLLLHLVVR